MTDREKLKYALMALHVISEILVNDMDFKVNINKELLSEIYSTAHVGTLPSCLGSHKVELKKLEDLYAMGVETGMFGEIEKYLDEEIKPKIASILEEVK